MADFKDRMADYVPVNERVESFKAAFPEGSLQSEIVELTASRVTVKALAYRTPDDPRPGIGHSSLEIPGSTPYTRGSEIENAETSAWGRAIAALGFEVKRGLASAEEVRNKQPAKRTAPVPSRYRRDELAALMAEHGLTNDTIEVYAATAGIPRDERPMSNESMDTLIDTIIESVRIEPAAVTAVEAGPEEGVPAPSGPASSRTVEEAIADAEQRAKVTA